MSEQKPAGGRVKDIIQQLSVDERQRLVKALASALMEQIRDHGHVENMRRLR